MKIILPILIIIAALSVLIQRISLDETNVCKSKIGTQIVLYSDTLMIVDYSLLNDNYTLSTGMQVNFGLIEYLLTIK